MTFASNINTLQGLLWHLPQFTEDKNEDGDSKRIILPPSQDSINLCCQDPQNLAWGLSEVSSKETPRQDNSNRLRSNNSPLSIQSVTLNLSCTKVTGRWISLLIQTLEDKSTKWGTACRKEDLLIHACRAVLLQKEPDRQVLTSRKLGASEHWPPATWRPPPLSYQVKRRSCQFTTSLLWAFFTHHSP